MIIKSVALRAEFFFREFFQLRLKGKKCKKNGGKGANKKLNFFAAFYFPLFKHLKNVSRNC